MNPVDESFNSSFSDAHSSDFEFITDSESDNDDLRGLNFNALPSQNAVPIDIATKALAPKIIPARIINYKYPCLICSKPCKDKVQDSICCFLCDEWVHQQCSDLTLNQFKTFCSPENANDRYYCQNCLLKRSSPSQPQIESCCSSATALGTINISNDIDSLTSNSVFRMNENMLLSEYLTTSELNIEMQKTPDDLLIIHINSVSLTLNYDAIHTLATLLKPNPSIIFLSETRVPLSPTDSQLNQILLEGYHKPMLTNSPTSAGGTAVYVSENLKYLERPDIKFNFPECESCFVEVECSNTMQNPILVLCTGTLDQMKMILPVTLENFLKVFP